MSKKEKVSIVRSDDFEEVDAILTEALASLDEANTRVVDLLESETHGTLSEAAEQKIAAVSGENASEETPEETQEKTTESTSKESPAPEPESEKADE